MKQNGFEDVVYLFVATIQARKFGGCQHKNPHPFGQW